MDIIGRTAVGHAGATVAGGVLDAGRDQFQVESSHPGAQFTSYAT